MWNLSSLSGSMKLSSSAAVLHLSASHIGSGHRQLFALSPSHYRRSLIHCCSSAFAATLLPHRRSHSHSGSGLDSSVVPSLSRFRYSPITLFYIAIESDIRQLGSLSGLSPKTQSGQQNPSRYLQSLANRRCLRSVSHLWSQSLINLSGLYSKISPEESSLKHFHQLPTARSCSPSGSQLQSLQLINLSGYSLETRLGSSSLSLLPRCQTRRSCSASEDQLGHRLRSLRTGGWHSDSFRRPSPSLCRPRSTRCCSSHSEAMLRRHQPSFLCTKSVLATRWSAWAERCSDNASCI